jgi:hypothetical protein
VIGRPTFHPQWGVEIRGEGDGHVVALGLPDRSIGEASFIDGSYGSVSQDLGSRDVAKTMAPVHGETRERVGEAWRRAILRTRSTARPALGLEGVTIYFSAWESGRGVISGEAWSPAT